MLSYWIEERRCLKKKMKILKKISKCTDEKEIEKFKQHIELLDYFTVKDLKLLFIG